MKNVVGKMVDAQVVLAVALASVVLKLARLKRLRALNQLKLIKINVLVAALVLPLANMKRFRWFNNNFNYRISKFYVTYS